jgi:hypothetical protein
MIFGAIISRAESLQILKHDLYKAALEKRAVELTQATAEERRKKMAQIEQDIEAEVRCRVKRVKPGSLLH